MFYTVLINLNSEANDLNDSLAMVFKGNSRKLSSYLNLNKYIVAYAIMPKMFMIC